MTLQHSTNKIYNDTVGITITKRQHLIEVRYVTTTFRVHTDDVFVVQQIAPVHLSPMYNWIVIGMQY